MNIKKLLLLVVDKSINNLENCEQFKVQTRNIKYLGCYISTDNLDTKDAERRWKECLQFTNKVTTNENLRLIQFKVMTQIYFSRDKIYTFDSNSSDKCLKGTQSDSLIHTFWFCRKF